MKRPSKWTWLWLSWLGAFVVLEILAARSKRKKPRTLSEHLWRWFPWRWKRIAEDVAPSLWQACARCG